MKRFKARKFLAALALGSAILFGGMAQSVAEAGVITDRLPFQCYVDHQVDTYNQPNGQRVGYISPNVDLIRVTQVRGDGWAYGDYPGKNGRVSRWFRITELCADPNYSNRGATVQGAQRVFRTKNSGDTIGSVSNNESVIVLADNGNRAQILYRLDNGTGYKVGWVPSSSVSSKRGSSNSSLKGDINGDGRVDNSDVELMRKYMVGMVSESQINKANADMNGDGTVDISDFAMLTDKVDNQSNQSQVNHNPQGQVQVAEGTAPNTLHVRGTAYDEDNPNASTRLHIYVGGGAGSGAPNYEIRTNGSNRIFDDTRNVGRSGNQHVYVYALNDYGSGENKEIWNGYVNIPSDSNIINLNVALLKQNDPQWKNVKISSNTIGGVGCTITSLAMKYNYHNNANITPPEMMRKLSFSGNSIIWSSVNRLGYTTYMVDNRPQPNNEWLSRIYTQLKAGKPVIVGAYQVNSSGKLAQHWVVVKGYNGNSTSSFNVADFQINDPMNPFSNLQQFFGKYNRGLRGIVY